MLAAVKPLKTENLAPSQNEESGTSYRDSSFRLTMVDAKTTKVENARSAGTAKARATEMADATEMSDGTKMGSATEMSDATQMSGLESLFREHHDRVFRAAHRVTGSAADAEDVLQTVFLRLARTKSTYQAPPAFDWSENPEAYLSRAAINASLDLLRKRKRARVIAMDDVESGVAMNTSATQSTPGTYQEDRELRTLIRAAVARLGEKSGAMFALRYFEGYDNGEIARLMGTSALVVGVTLHRARARLRKEIGSYLQQHGR